MIHDGKNPITKSYFFLVININYPKACYRSIEIPQLFNYLTANVFISRLWTIIDLILRDYWSSIYDSRSIFNLLKAISIGLSFHFVFYTVIRRNRVLKEPFHRRKKFVKWMRSSSKRLNENDFKIDLNIWKKDVRNDFLFRLYKVINKIFKNRMLIYSWDIFGGSICSDQNKYKNWYRKM